MSWVWLSKGWSWCKIHWKFILGISIPIFISILMRRGNANKIYGKAVEIKNQQLELEREAHAIELAKKRDAQKEFGDSIDGIWESHREALEKIENDKGDLIDGIDSAEKATAAIKDVIGD